MGRFWPIHGRTLPFLPASLTGEDNDMKKVARLILTGVVLGLAVVSVRGAFSSMFVMGDSISTTTNNPGAKSLSAYYYGQRFSNGRVWVEVLAQQQGLAFYPANNNSYFGNTSSNLAATINNFSAPGGGDLSNILFVIWVNDADLYYPALNSGVNLRAWTNAMNMSLTNHYKAIVNLYARGARTLIMPNAVDLSTIPAFDASGNASFIHARCLDYDAAFVGVLNQARANCPGLTIYMPDFYTLLANILADPAAYLVTNALQNGHSVDVMEDAALSNYTTNGPGTNHIFWDFTDPTAMVHLWMANTAQQLISPVSISGVTVFNGSNRLDLANVPVGQNGLILGCTNSFWLSWGNWTTNTAFIGTGVAQSVFVLTTNATAQSSVRVSPKDGPPMPPGGGSGGGTNAVPDPTMQFYRLSFPYSWTWP